MALPELRTLDVSQPLQNYFGAQQFQQQRQMENTRAQREQTTYLNSLADRESTLARQKTQDQWAEQDRKIRQDEQLRNRAMQDLALLNPDASPEEFQNQAFSAMDNYTMTMQQLGYPPEYINRTAQGIFKSGALTPEGVRALQIKQGLRTKPESITPTNLAKLISERDALPPSDPRRQAYDAALIKETTSRPAAEVNIDTGAKSMTELGKEMSKSLVTMRDDALGAAKALESLQEAKGLLEAGMITGTGAEFMVNFGNFLSSRLGVDFASDPVANTQAYAATMGNQVGQIIKQFGAGTGLSDADREYAEKIVGGKITLNEGAIRRLLAINEKAYRNVVKKYNSLADQAMSRPGAEQLPYDLRVEMPAAKKAATMSDEDLKKELGL